MSEILIKCQLPEDSEEFARYMSSNKLCDFMWDFGNYLRELYKYTDLSEKTADDLIDEIRDSWFEMMNDEGINLDELMS